jgi:hypothetical protein
VKTKAVMVILVTIGLAQAKEPRFYQKGVLTDMAAAECGFEEKGGQGVAGTLLGTEDQHKKTHEMLCQEYGLRADRLVYRIRPKEEKHPALLPVGEQAEFRIHKDRMFLRVPEGDGKEREYIVVSMTPRTDVKANTTAETAKGSQK